jgi:replicative DNA helicase Mcm
MAQSPTQELTDRFIAFYRNYYRDEIGQLAQRYPNEQRSLYVDHDDLYRFDPDLAEDYLAQPDQLQEYAEEALRLYDLPADVKLGQAHVRLRNVPSRVDIRNIRVHDDHVGRMVAVSGIVRKATDVRPRITEAAFECQRCGTMTYIPQADSGFQEPHECQGCERQGPFRVNFDQSEFVDSQKLRVQESPEGLRGGETPQSIDVSIEDDITGHVTPGDHVTVTGVLHIEQQTDNQQKTPIFDLYMDGVAIEIEDEEFEDMDITEADKGEIVALSSESNIYERMVDSIAPAIYGYREEKLAMILQLFSGVTKNLPDGSRIRGDLHMLLIGDPGTGKCLAGTEYVRLSGGTERRIGELVEENLENPKPVDDGVWDAVDVPLPSMGVDGRIETRRATKVWKREAPDRMIRIATEAGREIEVTPSHPLFVRDGTAYRAVRADALSAGQVLAAEPSVAADGGTVGSTSGPTDLSGLRVGTDRVASVETVEPDDDWVYDVEVEGTHTYLSNGLVSHNSQMLSYIENIAPRSVYTSGKGSSSAGLCVTGDTLVHTDRGFERIADLATNAHPDPVDEETNAPYERGLYTFDEATGTIRSEASSHVWRMPEKECRRIETSHGKRLEASKETPVLVSRERGLEWTPVADVEPGDFVAIPRYADVDRSTPPVTDYVEYTNERVRMDEKSVEFVVDELTERFGTLGEAADELGFSRDFFYDSLRHRYVPIDELDGVLDGIGADRGEVTIERAMLSHGTDVRVPTTFDEDLMYLLGLTFGDGDLVVSRRDGNRGHVRISNGDERLLRRAAEVVESTFDRRVEIERQDDRVSCIRLHSATVARLFENLGMRTPKDDLELDERLTTAEHADAFLRGLFDADGSVSNRTDGGSSIQLPTVSAALARQVQLMLETYGVRARVRERDPPGSTELDDGRTIEAKRVQYHLAIYGADIEAFADAIGFESAHKREALEEIIGDAVRRGDRIPVGAALSAAETTVGDHYNNVNRGDNPSRGRARRMIEELDLGAATPVVAEAVEADLLWDEVTDARDTGRKEVFDLTVPGTHNFVGNGVVTHNTAAAVRSDFGDGDQWTLEAGALVLADKGIAAVDELDKMRCVTGDTLVRLGDGTTERVDDLARRAAETGEIEPLPNGRTIRDVDLDVWTMSDDDRLVRRPVTAVHEYDAPDELATVHLASGESLTATGDHPFFVFEDGERRERAASALAPGDRVYVPRNRPGAATDGGASPASTAPSRPETSGSGDVELRQVAAVVRTESGPDAKVYDLTVEETHNFVANRMIVHNSEDRSAMHEALEQQQISISKAGINATLKSRCSLLGAANPKYGRFDQYEPIGEQIDLEPALISRFDLIFTVTDQPDPEHDRNLADHIIKTNYAGELNTQRAELPTSNFTQEEVDDVTDEVAPEIDADLLRKYIAYAKRNCFPTMTEAAKEVIREFYVDLRAKGADEDAPVPVTARKLEALVRLSEASARVRLSDTVQREDAERVTEIVESCLRDIGVDPETGQFDADVVETGTSKSQRDRIKNLKQLIGEIEEEYDEGAPIDEVYDRADDIGMEQSKVEKEIQKLKNKGDIYEPSQDHLRVV